MLAVHYLIMRLAASVVTTALRLRTAAEPEPPATLRNPAAQSAHEGIPSRYAFSASSRYRCAASGTSPFPEQVGHRDRARLYRERDYSRDETPGTLLFQGASVQSGYLISAMRSWDSIVWLAVQAGKVMR